MSTPWQTPVLKVAITRYGAGHVLVDGVKGARAADKGSYRKRGAKRISQLSNIQNDVHGDSFVTLRVQRCRSSCTLAGATLRGLQRSRLGVLLRCAPPIGAAFFSMDHAMVFMQICQQL